MLAIEKFASPIEFHLTLEVFETARLKFFHSLVIILDQAASGPKSGSEGSTAEDPHHHGNGADAEGPLPRQDYSRRNKTPYISTYREIYYYYDVFTVIAYMSSLLRCVLEQWLLPRS